MRNTIRHMVIFTLAHEQGSDDARRFLENARSVLSAIPTVRGFTVFRQVSAKNDFHYGFSMEFDGPEEYAAYNRHPAHVDFVERKWKTEVVDFLEIDLELIE